MGGFACRVKSELLQLLSSLKFFGPRLSCSLIRTSAHKKPLGLWVMKDPTDLWVIGQPEWIQVNAGLSECSAQPISCCLCFSQVSSGQGPRGTGEVGGSSDAELL